MAILTSPCARSCESQLVPAPLKTPPCCWLSGWSAGLASGSWAVPSTAWLMAHPALVAELGLVLAFASYPCRRVPSHYLVGVMLQGHCQGKLQSCLSCLHPAPTVLLHHTHLHEQHKCCSTAPSSLQHYRLNKYKPVLNDDYAWGSQAIQCWYGWSLLLGLRPQSSWSCFIYWQSHNCSMSFQMRDDQEAVSIINIHCWWPLSQDGNTLGILENVLHYSDQLWSCFLVRQQ